jgi:nitronate monooxygenase
VQAIWLSFGENLGRWIELVRNHDQKTGKSPKTLVFVQVNSVDEALLAVQTWKVDVLVAQGRCLQPLARPLRHSSSCVYSPPSLSH